MHAESNTQAKSLGTASGLPMAKLHRADKMLTHCWLAAPSVKEALAAAARGVCCFDSSSGQQDAGSFPKALLDMPGPKIAEGSA